jgi:signal transduction histidine kinase
MRLVPVNGGSPGRREDLRPHRLARLDSGPPVGWYNRRVEISTPLSPASLADRRAPAQAILVTRGTRDPGDPDAVWAHEKFITRARTLFYTRLAFLTIGLGLLAVPLWSEAFGIHGKVGFVVYFGMLAYSIANFMVVEHPVAGRRATLFTLILDLLVLVYLIEASGGLHSPLLATQLMFTTIFVILFPKPLYILPPLLTLPIVAKLDQIVGIRQLAVLDLLIMVWYSALNFITVYVIVYLNEREEAAHRDVVSLERDLQSMAVIEERNRLARDIHDGLGASLSSLIIQSEYLENLAHDEKLKKEIRELKSCAEESIDELRRSLRMMREDFELVPAIEDYCRTFSDRSKLAVRVERSGLPVPLAADRQLTIFRVLQESLTNASKHASAKEVAVRLRFDEETMTVDIADDGVGFDAKTTPRGHYGLINMRERANKIGGAVEIDSAPGKGTRVTLSFPTVNALLSEGL